MIICLNIWGLEKRLERGKKMRKKTKNKLISLINKKWKKRKDYDEIKKLEYKLGKVEEGLGNLRDKIKKIKAERIKRKK